MTRVLYIVDEAFPTTSANGRIVYRIIDELLKHKDLQITILCNPTTKEQFELTTYKNCPIVYTPTTNANKVYRLNKRLGKFKWLRYLLMPRTIRYRLNNKSDYLVAEMEIWIKKHLQDFDVIVANSMPFYPIEVASVFGRQKPVIYYKMEPVANYLRKDDFEKGKNIEAQWDNCASAIITEDLIYKFYQQYASAENLKKTIVAKFPCLIKRKDNANDKILNKDACNLVYVGKFYHNVRDPKYLFSLLEQIRYTTIHLTIAGGYKRLPKDYIERYFTNKIPYITYLGEVSADKADALLNEADILVHLGNKIADQMPSKIIDYISSGKPILNIYGIDNCPTLPYLKDYPLALNIKDGTEITEELINKIVEFIQQSKGKKIPFEQIEQQYKECTPQYVGQQFYETIKSVTK